MLPSVPNGIRRKAKLRAVLMITNGVLTGGQYKYDYTDVLLEEPNGRLVDIWINPGQLPPPESLAQNTNIVSYEYV